MLRQIGNIFSPPFFPEDEDKTRKARYVNVIALAFLVLVIGFETIVRIFLRLTEFGLFDLILFGVALICITSLVLLREGYVRLTSFLLVALVWLASNGIAATGFGARDASYIVNFAIILMTALLLGWKASLLITVLTIFSGFALAYAEQNALISTADYPITSFARDMTFVLVLNGVLIYLLINGLENALKKSKINLAQLESTNIDLNNAQGELENRSSALLSANQQLENRAKMLQGVVMITRTAALIQSLDGLLASITSTVAKELEYDHVGLYLLDEQKEFAILRSISSDGGQKLLERGYRIPVKQVGPIGFVVQTGQARLIQSTADDSNFFNKLDFPGPKSALVLPLRYHEQVIGLLDIRSAKLNTFVEDDISILTVLADQVAVTIQNLILYEESQRALRNADLLSLQTTAQAWKGYQKAIQTKGYRYDGIKSEPLKEAKRPGNGHNSVSVPIQLRGQTIGSFKLKPSDPSRAWTEDELVMVRATAERVALALESARLLEEAQRRATREAFLSNVSTKLSASFQLDSILRDTVQELGQTLKDSNVTFQLVNPADSGILSRERDDESSMHNRRDRSKS